MMQCTQCGTAQPISDCCIFCGHTLDSTHAIPTPSSQNPSHTSKYLFLLFLVILSGSFLFWPTHPEPVHGSFPTKNNAKIFIEKTNVTQKPIIFLMGTKEQHKTKLMQDLKRGLKAEVYDVMLDQKNAKKILKKTFQIENQNFLITLEEKANSLWQKNKFADVAFNQHFHLATQMGENSIQNFPDTTWVNLNPNPQKLVEIMQNVLFRKIKNITILYDSNYDEEYANILFATLLKEKWLVHAVSVSKNQAKEISFTQIPINTDMLIMIESPLFKSRAFKFHLRNFIYKHQISLVNIGSNYGSVGAILELTPNRYSQGQDLARLINQRIQNKPNQPADEILFTNSVRVTLYQQNTNQSEEFRAQNFFRSYTPQEDFVVSFSK